MRHPEPLLDGVNPYKGKHRGGRRARKAERREARARRPDCLARFCFFLALLSSNCLLFCRRTCFVQHMMPVRSCLVLCSRNPIAFRTQKSSAAGGVLAPYPSSYGLGGSRSYTPSARLWSPFIPSGCASDALNAGLIISHQEGTIWMTAQRSTSTSI